MFNGIVQDVGIVKKVNKDSQDWLIEINTSFNIQELVNGSSISCDGICLTVIKTTKSSFFVQASKATVEISNIKFWQEGYAVNLEKSMKIGNSIDGILTSGHVDCVAQVLRITQVDQSYMLKFSLPKQIKESAVYKGSIIVNGVALTVNKVTKEDFTINIIPYTWNHTNFNKLKMQEWVNIEIDYFARYIKRYMDLGISK